MADKISVMIYWKGNMVKTAEGIEFECLKAVSVKSDITIAHLRRTISEKIKLGPNERIFRIINRLPQKSNVTGQRLKYTRQMIEDDDDIQFMMAAFKRHKCDLIELYVEVEMVDVHHDGHAEGATERGFSMGADDVAFSMGFDNVIPSSCPINTQQSTTLPAEFHISQGLDVGGEAVVEGVADPIGNMLSDFSDEPEDDYHIFDDHTQPEADVGIDLDDDGQVLAYAMREEPIGAQQVQPLVVPPRGVFMPPCSQFSEINWDTLNNPDDIPELDHFSMWTPHDELFVGLRFPNKESATNALKHYSIKRHQTYKVVDSDSQRLYVKCPRFGMDCNWMVRVINNKKTDAWKINKYNGPHTCVNPTLSHDHRQLDVKMVCNCILGMIKQSPDVSTALIIERIQSQFGYIISYRKAWFAKQRAIEKVFGGWDESFALLPRWLMAMSEEMEGNVAVLEHEPHYVRHQIDRSKLRFQRVFWTFQPCVEAFSSCKPILQIDATHLYGKYRMKLLIAMTHDGDRKILPIAFAIVDEETKDNWGWFLNNIRQFVTQDEGICLISDRHPGILNAVKDDRDWREPKAFHRFCVRHVACNFNTKIQDQHWKNFLINTTCEPMKVKFQQKLDRLCEDPKRADFIRKMKVEKWSLAHDGGRRYSHMTSNLAECINTVLVGARKMPITALVQMIYFKLAEFFVRRKEIADKAISEGKVWTDNFLKSFKVMRNKSHAHRVHSFDPVSTRFVVEDAGNPETNDCGMYYTVNLSEQCCDCGRFQADHFPCSHAIAACKSRKIDEFQFVDPVYSWHSVAEAYKTPFEPIRDMLWWPKATGPKLIPNPGWRRKAKGRPKLTRIRNEMDIRESQTRQTCSRCCQVGCNACRCTSVGSSRGSGEGPSS